MPLDHAIQTLERPAANIHSEATVRAPQAEIVDQLETYVGWSIQTEIQLDSTTDRATTRSFFENPRHRDICTMPPVKHAVRLINAEIDHKAQQFRDLAKELTSARLRMTTAEGCPVVLDTNLLLQATRPDGVPWSNLVGESQVRLIIPLRVIEELDGKEYGSNDRLRQVAREVLPWLEGLFTGNDAGPVPLSGRTSTTVEVLLVDAPRVRPTDADEEILDACQEVELLVGSAKLVTADTGMRLRARAQGAAIVSLPEKYLRLNS